MQKCYISCRSKENPELREAHLEMEVTGAKRTGTSKVPLDWCLINREDTDHHIKQKYKLYSSMP